MPSTRRWKRVAIGFAVAGAVGAAAWIATRSVVPDWMRRKIEREASAALGRDLRIEGSFGVELVPAPRLRVTNVTLANARWGAAPFFARIGRASVSLELSSLWSRPIRLHDVSIDDAEVWLESDARGRGNWQLDLKRSEEPSPSRRTEVGPLVTFDRIALHDLEIERATPGGPPGTFAIASLEARLEPDSGMIDLDAEGRLNDTPWNLAGRLGTFDHLVALHDVEQAVTGRLGEANVSLRGRIRDVSTLGDPHAEIAVDGPDLAATLSTFRLRSPVSGPFALKAQLTPSEGGVDIDLEAEVSEVRASVRGRVDALLGARAVEGDAEVSGPDATAIGSWTRIRGLPPGPFRVTAGFGWHGEGISLHGTNIRAGRATIDVEGTIGPLPRCVGTDLRVAGRGPDLSRLAKLTRLRLPGGPFEVRGRFLRREDGLAVEDVDLRSEGVRVIGGGTIGEPPRVPNLDMRFDASGPNLGALSGIARVKLPSVPFVVRGRVAREGGDWTFEHVEGRVDAAGFDLDARLAPAPRLVGSEVRVSVSGPDLEAGAGLAGFRGLPAVPYQASGRVRVAADGFDVREAEARAGGLDAGLEGHVGAFPSLQGTAVEASVSGSALSDLDAWGVSVALPSDPFQAAGRVRIDGGAAHLDGVSATVGSDRARVDGMLGPWPHVSALDLSLDASGPSLRALARFAPSGGDGATGRLPVEPYTMTGRVVYGGGGLAVSDVRAEIGNGSLRLDGLVGLGPRLDGTDLRFAWDAPDSATLAGIAGLALPEGAAHLQGGISRSGEASRLDAVTLAIGDHRAEVSGTLGDPPGLGGTDLTVHASGPDVGGVVVPMTGLSPAPSGAFDVAARLHGNAGRLTAEPVSLRLGDSNLEGAVSVDLTGRPTVSADLRSDRLDVASILAGLGFEASERETPPREKPKKARSKNARVIPDEPLSLEPLRRVDADLRLRSARLDLPRLPLRDVAITATLRDGTLRVEPIEGTGPRGGRAKASLLLEPVDGAYHARIDAALDDAKLDFSSPGEASVNAPEVDLDLEIEGTGRSLHEMAASSDGRGLAVLGAGEIPSSFVDRMSSGVFRSLIDTMNPARKTSASTKVECGVVGVEIDDGKAAFDPIAARTDKMTATGRGKIDFGSEAIDLSWTIKSRKGVGLSAGSIANPYLKLGGTLAAPALEAKPLEAVTSTGAAVATMGLTILFRSVYERITAEKKVCVDALEKAQKNKASRRRREAAESERKDDEP